MRDTKRWMPGDCGVVLQLLNCGLETQIEDRPFFHRFMQDGSRMSSLTLWWFIWPFWIHSIEID
jgi:hypothetical protein